MKIYTKNGDDGFTFTPLTKKVSKNNALIKAIGDIDELNSWMGFIVEKYEKNIPIVCEFLIEIQHQLLSMGAAISTDASFDEDNHCKCIEDFIDDFDSELPKLTNFVIPSGGSVVHIARSVCRRAERHIVAISHYIDSKKKEAILKYINRLSDLFFVLSRYIAIHVEGVAEISWKK